METINMEIMIRFLDVCNTLLEMLILYACAQITCRHTSCGAWYRFIPYIGEAAVVYLITWVIPMDTTKILIEMIVWCLLMKAVTRDKWRNIIVAFCLSFYIIAAVSFFEMTFIKLLLGANSAMFEERVVLIWQNYILAMIVNIFVIAGIFRYGKHFQYEIRVKDAAVISSVTLIFYAVCFSIGAEFYAGKREWYDVVSATAAMLFGLCFLLLLLFYKNNMYLKEQNQAANRQVREAQMQYQYYLEKEKQEEKVRSIYHDMKNHLLLLERGQVPDETRRLAERIRNEISGYEGYMQTGNRFLDIILNDKMQKAKEGNIDFSVLVDFSEISFIDSLDISTIFGNGIDNALEACVKLPPEKRIVIVKGCKRKNFVLILIENNFAQQEDRIQWATDKDDVFMHGFGIANIRRAVSKYGGECKIVAENGRFFLTIIIPFPMTEDSFKHSSIKESR